MYVCVCMCVCVCVCVVYCGINKLFMHKKIILLGLCQPAFFTC